MTDRDDTPAAGQPEEGSPVHVDDAGGTVTAQPGEQEGQPPVQHYIATEALPRGDEMGGEAGQVRAFSPGDAVPAEHVERFSWWEWVKRPDGQPMGLAPAQPAFEAEPPPGAEPVETGPADAVPAQPGPAETEAAGPLPQVAAPDEAPTSAPSGREET